MDLILDMSVGNSEKHFWKPIETKEHGCFCFFFIFVRKPVLWSNLQRALPPLVIHLSIGRLPQELELLAGALRRRDQGHRRHVGQRLNGLQVFHQILEDENRYIRHDFFGRLLVNPSWIYGDGCFQWLWSKSIKTCWVELVENHGENPPFCPILPGTQQLQQVVVSSAKLCSCWTNTWTFSEVQLDPQAEQPSSR